MSDFTFTSTGNLVQRHESAGTLHRRRPEPAERVGPGEAPGGNHQRYSGGWEQ